MKGIILAGGSGSRLYPATKIITKQLLDIGGKPMIYYPLTQLMLAGIRDILLISTPHNIELYQNVLEDGSQWGISIEYAIQEYPGGLAQAFLLPKYKNYISSEDFIGEDSVTLILGDNIFYGPIDYLDSIRFFDKGAVIFAKYVKDPERFGVVEFDKNFNALSLEEKPVKPKSHFAVTGLYAYDNNVISFAKRLKPSSRGELEITDLNNIYLQEGLLKVVKLRRGIAWFDTGTKQSIENVRQFIMLIESNQATLIGSPEEVAFRMGYIDKNQFEILINNLPDNEYKILLSRVLEEF